MRSGLACALPVLAATAVVAGCGSSTPAPANSNSAATAAATPSSAGCPPVQGASTRTTSFTQAPPMCVDANKTYTANVTTDVGAFTIVLDAKKAPKTVNNFVFLARHKYFDGIVFHRVIKGFMAQTGDPQGTGAGGPGYEFADELPKAGEYKLGSVAMANPGQPDMNGSQFFVVTGPAGTQLPPQYSLFGQVTSGMETVKKIEADGGGGNEGVPAKQHRMTQVTITEK